MIGRKKIVKLDSYDASWKGSFIEVKIASFRETIEMNKTISRVERELYKAERAIKKAEKSEDTRDFEAISALMEARDGLSIAQLDVMAKMAKGAFVRGQIVDGELRDMTINDLEDFDIEVLGDIIKVLTGQTSGKA